MSILKNNTFAKLFDVIDGDTQGQILVLVKDDEDDHDAHYVVELTTECEGIRMSLGLGFKTEPLRQDAFDLYGHDDAAAFFKVAKQMITEASVGEDQETS